MLVLHWIWSGIGTNEVPPNVVYYTLRALMFISSFILEDWATHELVQSPRHRRLAVTLVASSYVTWTYQTHTFSNSIETLLVAWSLVMIQRLLDNKVRPTLAMSEKVRAENEQQRSSLLSSAILGCLITFGIFNRVTFPAYLLIPSLFLLPHFFRRFDHSYPSGTQDHANYYRPLSLAVFSIAIVLTTNLAIVIDTDFYHPGRPLLNTLLTNPTFTPLNSFLYNTQTSNLATHGLHPHYQHLVGSLPLLLGPALCLCLFAPIRNAARLPALSAVSGTLFLSCIPHQEPRFLLPAVPLLLSSIRLPRSKSLMKYWLSAWVAFNTLFGVLIGIYHQGGVVPAQLWLGQQSKLNTSIGEVLWWRTYSPPIWLLNHTPIETTDLMGIPFASLQLRLETALGPGCNTNKSVGLVAPFSSMEIDPWIAKSAKDRVFTFEEIWRYHQHLNLDDLDIGKDGVWGTLRRVVGRRGLVVWKVRRLCGDRSTGGGVRGILHGDW